MLHTLWSDPLRGIVFLAVAAGLAFAVSWIQVVLENRRSRITTADELRTDAATPERRARLKRLQGRLGSRRAS
jgi:hypothetical protein